MTIPSEKSAKRYTRSIFEMSDAAELDSINDQLKIAKETIPFRGTLFGALADPRYNLTQRYEAIETVLKKSSVSNQKVINLVKTLVESRKLNLLPSISAQFSDLLMKLREQLSVKITSAFPTAASEFEPLNATLKKQFSGLASLDIKVDSSLIGGMKVCIGDKVVDASIKGALERAAVELSK